MPESQASSMDMDAIEQSRKQLQTAQDLAERNETIYPQIFFAENLVTRFGRFMHEDERNGLMSSVNALRAVTETGTLEETLKARDEMRTHVDKQSRFMVFAHIENAIDLQYANHQTQAERLMRQRDELFKMLEKNEIEKFSSTLNEMMPEIYGIIEKHGKRKMQIWKGVRKAN
jgi:hypothetical protein